MEQLTKSAPTLAPSTPRAPVAARHNARAGFIAAIIVVSYAYFYAGTSANSNSRFDLVRAIVEQHTLRIDAYQQNTGDKALWNGHYYSDKAPGQSLAAVPVVAVAHAALMAAGANPLSRRSVWFLNYLASIATVVLPSALSAACLYFICIWLGTSGDGALFAALCYALATPMWAYGTAFLSHALTASCLVFAFAAAVALRQYRSPQQDILLGAAVGLFGGWATISEFPAVIAAAILAILAVLHTCTAGAARVRRVTLAVTAAAFLCFSVLWVYQVAAFGSLFNLGYSHHATFAQTVHTGFFGVTYPKLNVLLHLLIGTRRGLLPLAPVLILAPFGFVTLWKKPNARSSALAAVAIAVYFLLFNASFRDWYGGWIYGPRYLSPGLPFLCLGLAPLWMWARPWLRSVLLGFALIGVALSLIAVTTTVSPPDAIKDPIRDYLWPAFRSGHIPLNEYGFNLGTLAGLHGLTSLVPLLGAWALILLLSLGLSTLRHKPAAP